MSLHLIVADFSSVAFVFAGNAVATPPDFDSLQNANPPSRKRDKMRSRCAMSHHKWDNRGFERKQVQSNRILKQTKKIGALFALQRLNDATTRKTTRQAQTKQCAEKAETKQSYSELQFESSNSLRCADSVGVGSNGRLQDLASEEEQVRGAVDQQAEEGAIGDKARLLILQHLALVI